mgnify:CR=1 FL=1
MNEPSSLAPELAAWLANARRDGSADAPTAQQRANDVAAAHRAKPWTALVDRLAVAELLLGSDVVADVELAQTLALAALAKSKAARPLAARAFDRLRRLAGQPQKYGTEVVVRDGGAELWPVDGVTTDSERAKWGIAPLAELQRAASSRGRE